ncbi:MAG: SIMPL domain-containing protein [bacterium]|nr:SIMPL domain-containing protein [bacterium]
MNIQQTLKTPFGISTFGSSMIRVEPDMASLGFAVSRLEQRPKDAFSQARKAAKKVGEYLKQAGIKDVGSSRITLSQSFKYTGGEQHFTGYSARIAFNVLLRDLDRIEEILTGVTDAGANEINQVDYQTGELKELRAKARRQAVAAAREKAEIYCQAAGVTLGPVIHIEDVNPDQLHGREGHVTQETQTHDDGPLRAINPGSIMVGGAVIVGFELGKT